MKRVGGERRSVPVVSPLATGHRPLTTGFTLIEMLIVVSIMMLLMGMTAAVMRPATESRRTREAARMVNAYLSSARNRAIELGRPCGVTFHTSAPAGAAPFAMTADQCEVPASYSGVTETSTLTVTAVTTPAMATITGTSSDFDASQASAGDTIQLNGQGPWYTVTGTVTNGVTGTVSLATGLQIPWDATGRMVSYRINRLPSATNIIKGGTRPLQLPTATVIDFSPNINPNGWDPSIEYAVGASVKYNGKIYYCLKSNPPSDCNIGKIPSSSPTYWELANSTNYIVLFSPTGSVDSIYTCNQGAYGGVAGRQVVTDPIYLLVGKRERMVNALNDYSAAPPESDKKNFQDLNNFWIVVNPQTGLIMTGPVAESNSQSIESAAINKSCELAADMQGVGGK